MRLWLATFVLLSQAAVANAQWKFAEKKQSPIPVFAPRASSGVIVAEKLKVMPEVITPRPFTNQVSYTTQPTDVQPVGTTGTPIPTSSEGMVLYQAPIYTPVQCVVRRGTTRYG